MERVIAGCWFPFVEVSSQQQINKDDGDVASQHEAVENLVAPKVPTFGEGFSEVCYHPHPVDKPTACASNAAPCGEQQGGCADVEVMATGKDKSTHQEIVALRKSTPISVSSVCKNTTRYHPVTTKN